MSNKTRKIYKGGDPPERWMLYNPQPVAGRLGSYITDRANILEAIEENEDASKCIKLFSGLSYNLLVGVFNYWKILRQQKMKGTLNMYIDNKYLMNILEYVDLSNFPENFETFCCYKFLLKGGEKGTCTDPGKTFEVDVFPPEATIDFYQTGNTPSEAEKAEATNKRNMWVTQQVEDLLIGNDEGEFGNTREIFYLLNELFHSDCPGNNKGPYYKERYSVMNVFWTLIWCRAIVNSHETMEFRTSNEHIDLINDSLFNGNIQINVSEIDERINMLITIYGAKNIFQIIRIPDGDYHKEDFIPVAHTIAGVQGNAKLAIITGNFESKINVCHMGRPKVVPHIALSSIIKPSYRAIPVGEPVIVTDKDGTSVIRQSEKVYIDEIKNLQNELRKAREKGTGEGNVIKKFQSLGPFTDKNGLQWVSCIAPCVCMTIDEGVTQKCSTKKASCNSTGNFLALPVKERISRPRVQYVKYPVLSNRELEYLFSDEIKTWKKRSVVQPSSRHYNKDPDSIQLTNQELRSNVLRDQSVPWEIGQWFIRVNPKSIGYKIAQQNQTLLTTGISNHARLIMDFFSLFTPFTDFNNKQLLTARVVSSLIQPIHHTFNEVMKSVEYLGINYDPTLPEMDTVNRLLTIEKVSKIEQFKKLFGTISYQTIVPYLNQNQYDELYKQPNELEGDGFGFGFGDDDEEEHFGFGDASEGGAITASRPTFASTFKSPKSIGGKRRRQTKRRRKKNRNRKKGTKRSTSRKVHYSRKKKKHFRK